MNGVAWRSLEWTIQRQAVFDFLSHPAVLYAMDPEFRVIDLICDLVEKAGDNAEIVSADAIAESVKAKLP